MQVTVGQLSLILPDPGEQRYQIRNIIVHENYNDTSKFNDIALLEVIVLYNRFCLINYHNNYAKLDLSRHRIWSECQL